MTKPICNHCWNESLRGQYHCAIRSTDVCEFPAHQIGAFKLGEIYTTQEGKSVKIIEESTMPSYEWVRGDDNICRYNRPNDRGRVTASNFDMSCPQNLVVK